VQTFPTHPKSFNDQISGLKFSLHDAQKGQELWFAQVVNVQLAFLKDRASNRKMTLHISDGLLDPWQRRC